MAEAKDPVGHEVGPDELLSDAELAEATTWPRWKTQLGSLQSSVVNWGREHPYWPWLALALAVAIIWYFKRKS